MIQCDIRLSQATIAEAELVEKLMSKLHLEDPAHVARSSSDIQPDAMQIVPYMPPEPVATQIQRRPSDNGLQIAPYTPAEPAAARKVPTTSDWHAVEPVSQICRFGAQVSSTYA